MEVTSTEVESFAPKTPMQFDSPQESEMEYKMIEETAAMEYLLSDGIPPIDGRPPYMLGAAK